MKFYEGIQFNIELEELGDTWQLEGIVIGNGRSALIMQTPDSPDVMKGYEFWKPGVSDLEAWLKQSDNPVMTIADKSNPLGYAVIRKASRQLDQAVVWKVYERDSYTCVYCGATGVPLTYDHYLAQMFGGLTTIDNGRTSCRPCNKRKGHMTIAEWAAYCQQKGLNDGATIPT